MLEYIFGCVLNTHLHYFLLHKENFNFLIVIYSFFKVLGTRSTCDTGNK
jgi:hypothetical protein